VDDGGKVTGATSTHDEAYERGGRGRRLGTEQVLDDGLASRRWDQLIGQRAAQLVGGLERAGEPEELVLDLLQAALGAGHLEQRGGVRLGAVGAHRAWLPTSAM